VGDHPFMHGHRWFADDDRQAFRPHTGQAGRARPGTDRGSGAWDPRGPIPATSHTNRTSPGPSDDDNLGEGQTEWEWVHTDCARLSRELSTPKQRPCQRPTPTSQPWDCHHQRWRWQNRHCRVCLVASLTMSATLPGRRLLVICR
jgi:hypothetical protein